jgi:hypothetical protein
MDRYFALVCCTSLYRAYVIATASVFLAAAVMEEDREPLDKDLIRLATNYIASPIAGMTEQEVRAAERRMLQVLDWRIQVLTPHRIGLELSWFVVADSFDAIFKIDSYLSVGALRQRLNTIIDYRSMTNILRGE